QACAERTALNTFGRAAAIQIDFVIAPLLRECRASCEIAGLAAAKLEGDRMFFIIEVQMTRNVPMQQRTRGHHFGVQPGVLRQKSMKIAAMAIRPIHHGCNGYASGACFHRSSEIGSRGGASHCRSPCPGATYAMPKAWRNRGRVGAPTRQPVSIRQ